MRQPNVRTGLNLTLALLLLWGCHSDAPDSSAEPLQKSPALLEQLTSVNESERFAVLKKAMDEVSAMSRADIEGVLVSLRQKNVSTLIYAFIKSQNEQLYHLGPAARTALENSPGSFPNIAYYYAKVKPTEGIKSLSRLYDQYADKRMAICLSIGSIKTQAAKDFLLSKAKSELKSGKPVLAPLSGLQSLPHAMNINQILFFLDHDLGREEVIALSEVKVEIPHEQLKKLWQSPGQKKEFAIQNVLGDPHKNIASLRWIVKQLEQAGDTDAIRQILFSDGMRNLTPSDLKQFREATLKKLERSGV